MTLGSGTTDYTDCTDFFNLNDTPDLLQRTTAEVKEQADFQVRCFEIRNHGFHRFHRFGVVIRQPAELVAKSGHQN